MEIENIINSFKSTFETAEGAYAYLLINSIRPELLSISSKTETKRMRKDLTESLQKAQSFKDVVSIISTLSDEGMKSCLKHTDNVEAYEQKLEPKEFSKIFKKNLIKAINNISYLDLEWDDKEKSWDNIRGLIEFNKNSPLLSKVEENIIAIQVSNFQNRFGIKELNLNSCKYPLDKINELEQAFSSFAKLLNIPENKIGLDTLTLSIQSENTSVSGYSGYNQDFSNFKDKILLNDISSFAHEWFHFIDGSMGEVDRDLTDFLSFSEEDRKSFFPNFKELLSFGKVIEEKAKVKSLDFNTAMKGSLYFLGRFAANKETYIEELNDLSNQLLDKINNNAPQKEIHDMLEAGLKKIAPDIPVNYCAFGKAVCDIETKNKNKQELNKNQFYAYAEINDSYLDMGDYSSSKLEMIARSFEKFISDTAASSNAIVKELLSVELSEQEKNSLFLITEKNYDSDFFPQGEIADKLSIYWSKAIPEISKVLDESSSESKNHRVKSLGNNVAKFLKKRESIEIKENNGEKKLSK